MREQTTDVLPGENFKFRLLAEAMWNTVAYGYPRLAEHGKRRVPLRLTSIFCAHAT